MIMLLKLIKTNINVSFGISDLKYRFTKEKKKLWEPILVIAGAVLGIGSMLLFFYFFMLSTFHTFKQTGQPEIVLAIAFMGSQFFLLFFGIFHIISSFFFSKDLNFLIPLPLKPYQVLASKFVVIIINEYIMTVPMVMPAIIVYGTGMQKGLLYWIKGLVSLLLVPIIPLVISALLVIILMRFVNIRKSKDIFVVVGSIIGLVAGIGINFYVQTMVNEEQLDPSSMAQAQLWILDSIGNRFPPSIWASYGLANDSAIGWGYFLMFLTVSVAFFILLLWVGNSIFYKGVMTGDETYRKRKAISLEQVDGKHTKALSPLMALFLREWRILLRTPVFMMNGLAGVIMFPIMAAMSMFTQSENSVGTIVELAMQPQNSVYVSIAGLGIMIFSSSMNIVSSTAFSREGKSFWISKMIPVPASTQVISKIMHGMVISCIGILMVAIAMIVVLKYSLIKLLVLFILAVMGAMIITVLDLIVDLFNPKLNWTSPHEAVKTNFNGLLGVLVSMIFLGIIGVLVVIMLMAGLSEWMILLSLFIIKTAVLIPSVILLIKLSVYKYKYLEI